MLIVYLRKKQKHFKSIGYAYWHIRYLMNVKLKYAMLATEQISQILPVSFVRYFLITLPR
jgi:hypothetical protein